MKLYRYQFYNGVHWNTEPTIDDYAGYRNKKRQIYPTGYVEVGEIVAMTQPECSHSDMEYYSGQFVCTDCDKKFKPTAFEEIKETK